MMASGLIVNQHLLFAFTQLARSDLGENGTTQVDVCATAVNKHDVLLQLIMRR